jgi:hypothetical protein
VTTRERLISVPAHAQRPDLYLHALAQLPDNTSLELSERLPEGPALQLLAESYDIADRVRFTSTPEEAPTGPSIATMGELVEGLALLDDPPATCRAQSSDLSGHRVAIVTNVPAPYRLPLFAEMDSRLQAGGASLRVFFLGAGDHRRPWIRMGTEASFEHEIVASIGLPLRKRRPRVPMTLEHRLRAFHPSIVLCGGFSPAVAGRVARFARRTDALAGIWSGEHAGMATASSGLRLVQRRRLARQAQFAVAYGFRAGEYLRHLAPGLPFVYGRNTSVPSAMATTPRARLDRLECVAVGDMSSHRKGVDVLIDALRLAPDVHCRLTLVGGGALLPRFREHAHGDDRIQFAGPLPSERVRDLYASADALLFPSRGDVFGLVLVEGMGSGLATVTSRVPGAVADLAVDGRNCLIVDRDRPDAWADAIRRLSNDDALRRLLGENARTTIERRWTIAHAADAMVAGFRLAALRGERG